MRILTGAQMREAERRAIAELGISSAVLMENAGREVVAAMEEQLPTTLVGRRITVVCGKGNNGGDGFVVARMLAERGGRVTVCVAAPRDEVSGDARAFLTALDGSDVAVVDAPTLDAWEASRSRLLGCDLLVDALFGAGVTRPLEGYPRAMVEDLNLSGVPIVAIDLPSGLSADEGVPFGEAIEATLTVALGAVKVALLVPPAAAHAGDLMVADIGIPDAVLEALDGPECAAITQEWAASQISPRPDEVHKGDYGRVLVVGGAVGTTGAAVLAAMGALRSGAGLVTVGIPRVCQGGVAAHVPDYMTLGLADTEAGTVHPAAAQAVASTRADVIALGPGLGQSADVSAFVEQVLEVTDVPLVLDADGLNALGDGWLRRPVSRPLVITPHPGEMARLIGASVEDVQADRLGVARRLAADAGIFVVLKGARTVVATPYGRVWINVTGNPGMATGGTGDVLTGVIAAWIAQTGDLETACALGVYLHGAAGDLAADEQGEVGMIASDLLLALGPAAVGLTVGSEPEI